MIRKAIIVVLTLSTFLSVVPWFVIYNGFGIEWRTCTGSDVSPLPAFPMHELEGGLSDKILFIQRSRMPRSMFWGDYLKRLPENLSPGFKWRVSDRGGMASLFPESRWRPAFIRIGPNVHMVSTPLWLVTVVLATYPTIAFIRGPLRRRRRRKRGQCLHCGYSLEGNVTGVCPECGEKA